MIGGSVNKAMTSDHPAIRFYFFLRSPYVWLAAEQLIEDEIEVRPVPVVGFADGTVFGDPTANPPRLAYLIEDVARLAARRGLTLLPPIDVDDWAPVQRMSHHAIKAGHGLRFVQAAGRARWTESKSLSCPDVIAEVAQTAGLDEKLVQSAMQDPGIDAEMRHLYRTLIEQDQVFGVPFFAFDADGKTHRYWGQDRIGMMLEDARQMGVC